MILVNKSYSPPLILSVFVSFANKNVSKDSLIKNKFLESFDTNFPAGNLLRTSGEEKLNKNNKILRHNFFNKAIGG